MTAEANKIVRKTLSRFLHEKQNEQSASLPDDLLALLGDVATACKNISHLVNQGALAGILGSAGSENIQGEQQKNLDVIANDEFIDATLWNGKVAGLASEEMDHMYPMPAACRRGRYLVTFDPLDGSTNIDVNGSVGTIFSILTMQEEGDATDESFLQKGSTQVCAGYCLYSSASMLVLTTGSGVDGFTLDDHVGEFVLTHPKMIIPESTSEYAINASNVRHWQPAVQTYIEEVVAGVDGPRGRNFNMRWAGSMVGDVHRVLCRGGVFMYPIDNKMIAEGKAGKLRLLYEASPMGLLVEQAGGLATTGTENILDIQPASLHQRVPVIMGSSEEVRYISDCHSRHG